MKQLVAFFETDPRVIAQEFFIKKIVLQTLFRNKNLYRYHRDFEHRWRLIYEQTLVSDLAHLPHSTDFGEKELYQVLTKNKVESTPPTAQGLQDFLDNLRYPPFSDITFCNILISQVQKYRQSEQAQIYSLLQTFLFYFANNYETAEPRLSRQWQSLSSFFVGAQGEITPFFRAISAHLLYTMSGRSRSNSGAHLKGASAKKSKQFPNNILGLPLKLDYERQLILKTIKNIESAYQQGEAVHALIAQPLIKYFEQHYDVRVQHHTGAHNALIGFFPRNQSQAFWISSYDCLPANAATLYDKFLDLYLDEIIRGKIIDVFKDDPCTPEHHLSSIGEVSDSDNDEADSDDFEGDTDWSRSLSSDSGRMRGSSIEAHWSSFGNKWRHKADSEKLPYLLKGLSRRYGWPQDFLTVALSSLNRDTVVISERDYYILTKEQVAFQCNAFQALRLKWDRDSMEVLGQPYTPSPVVFPFIEQKNVADVLLQQMNRKNVFFTLSYQRYKCIDTPSLEALLTIAQWDESFDKDLITEAFSSGSLAILERVLAKRRLLVGPWVEILKRGLFEKNFNMVEMLIINRNTTLTVEDWLILTSWAVQREDSCGLQEIALYMSIAREFESLLSTETASKFWTEALLKEPDLFEKRVIFCPKWGYPDTPQPKTFLENLDIHQKIARYHSWFSALNSQLFTIQGLWRLIVEKEQDLLSKKFARLCLGEITSPEDLIEQIRSSILLLTSEDAATVSSVHNLMIKIYLYHHPEQAFSLIRTLFDPAQRLFLEESVLQQLQRTFSPASAEQLKAQYEKIKADLCHKPQVLTFSQSLSAQEVSVRKKNSRVTFS